MAGADRMDSSQVADSPSLSSPAPVVALQTRGDLEQRAAGVASPALQFRAAGAAGRLPPGSTAESSTGFTQLDASH